MSMRWSGWLSRRAWPAAPCAARLSVLRPQRRRLRPVRAVAEQLSAEDLKAASELPRSVQEHVKSVDDVKKAIAQKPREFSPEFRVRKRALAHTLTVFRSRVADLRPDLSDADFAKLSRVYAAAKSVVGDWETAPKASTRNSRDARALAEAMLGKDIAAFVRRARQAGRKSRPRRAIQGD